MDWSHIPRSPGVYQISTPSGKFYFGKSKDMRRRCTRHFSELVGNTHDNLQLQRSYNKYKSKLKFKVLVNCDEASIHYLEAYYITLFRDDPKCMNVLGPTNNYKDYGQRHDAKRAYCAVYWSRQIYIVDGMWSWARELGKDVAYRGCKGLNAANVWRIFDTKEQAIEWFNQCDSEWIQSALQKEIKLNERREKAKKKAIIRDKTQFLKWSFHVKHQSGRASIARNTYELKQFRVCDGWIHRRKGEPWPEKKIGTPSKPVYGWHAIYGFQQWVSIGACSRLLCRSHLGVYKALNGGQKTCAGWHLSHAPITDPNPAENPITNPQTHA
jgi:predicted GIY-YIG superfamily endonuclease